MDTDWCAVCDRRIETTEAGTLYCSEACRRHDALSTPSSPLLMSGDESTTTAATTNPNSPTLALHPKPLCGRVALTTPDFCAHRRTRSQSNRLPCSDLKYLGINIVDNPTTLSMGQSGLTTLRARSVSSPVPPSDTLRAQMNNALVSSWIESSQIASLMPSLAVDEINHEDQTNSHLSSVQTTPTTSTPPSPIFVQTPFKSKFIVGSLDDDDSTVKLEMMMKDQKAEMISHWSDYEEIEPETTQRQTGHEAYRPNHLCRDIAIA